MLKTLCTANHWMLRDVYIPTYARVLRSNIKPWNENQTRVRAEFQFAAGVSTRLITTLGTIN